MRLATLMLALLLLTSFALAADSVDAVMSELRSEDAAVRREAQAKAVEVGAPMVAPLCELMAEDTPLAVDVAEKALMAIVAAASDSPGDRDAVADALGEVALSDESDGVRVYATRMLGVGGGVRALNGLHRALGRPETQDVARVALERMADPGATAVLLGMVFQVDPASHAAIIRSIGARRDVTAVTALVFITGRGRRFDAGARAAAAEALGMIGDASAAETLADLLEDEDAAVREAACGALIALADEQQRSDGPFARRYYRRAYDHAQTPAQATAALMGYADTSPPFDRVKWLLEGMKNAHTRRVAAAELRATPVALVGGPLLQRLASAEGPERDALAAIAADLGLPVQ